ncbi:OprD family outer membrane porin [Thiopseudomonas acetoxidans]|uniref:OprD family outer membrane porin n=1 Tax=Thiopseudomonas acetoxidans TaxID=3041622 RepID=A0ABT7SQU0_9GAMM|nr:OprD family outer membrane porin [Thiopseudomonas sp. CY1220]MDM7858563.1 OprD family outer membrane porin [Thiopseudomonas sp. CY1220]
MQKMKWSVIAFAVAAASTQMAAASQQSESQGFIEDSKLDLHARTLYFNRDFRNGATNVSPANAVKGQRKGYREETGLGLKAIYESGFTQGTVGFGVDAFGLQGIKLDSGGGRHHEDMGMFPTDGRSGKAQDNYSQAGGAVKARLSNTTLKYGEQFVDLPVLSTDDSRLLPETTTGFLVTSNEIEGLELHAGHFTALTAMDQTFHDSSNNGQLRSIDLVGGRYNITDDLSTAYYYSDADLGHKGAGRRKAKKHYLNVNYNYPIAENQSFAVDFNAYSTRFNAKDEARGERTTKNNVRSLAFAYNLGAHTFTVARQCVEGNHDAGYEYGYDGGGSVYLANDVQYTGFHQKGEVSNQVRYDLDLETFGVPGLSFMTRYVRGSKIASDGNRHQGKNWERDIDVRYVVQSGVAKDLSLHVRNATYRANDAAGNPDINEVRFIAEYPLSIL